MGKVYLGHLYGYTKKDTYSLAFKLGDRLVNFLGEDVFTLLLDSRVLMSAKIKGMPYSSHPTFRLHPATQALEAFLEKIIKGKKLREAKHDRIGDVFGKKDSLVRRRIKDKRLIAKTKSVWDFCRNDVVHYSERGGLDFLKMHDRYDEIIDLMISLYRDFYGKSEPSDDVKRKIGRYLRTK